MSKEKSLHEYKLGEVCKTDLLNGIVKAPSKLVRLDFTFQNEKGVQMTLSLKHKDYDSSYESDEDDEDEEDET